MSDSFPPWIQFRLRTILVAITAFSIAAAISPRLAVVGGVIALLMSIIAHLASAPQSMTTIARYRFAHEAGLAKNLLAANDIAAFVHNELAATIFGDTAIAVRLLVAVEDESRARQILAAEGAASNLIVAPDGPGTHALDNAASD